ncbi:MAG: threonine/serine exporter family protein [Clostridia bacterium]|nr:threonine/serine exporter family protein [Clostridia bacterium]
MKELIQLIASFVGAIGFSLIFGLHGKQILLAGIGGACTWGVCLLTDFLGCSLPLAIFFAAVFGSFYSECLAKILRVPKTVFLFSVLISLIPGSNLYLAMRYAIEVNRELAMANAIETLTVALAISLGIIVMLVTSQIQARIKSRGNRN